MCARTVAAAHDAPDHVGEFLPGDGLQDDGVEFRHVEIAACLDIGGLGDDRDVREPRILSDRGGELGAVHLRHPHIGEDQVDRLFFEQFERGLAGFGGKDVHAADLGENRLRDAEVHRHVVDDEDPDGGLVFRHGRSRGFRRLPLRRRRGLAVTHAVERDAERASLAELTGAGQAAVHARGQTLGDGKSESGAVVHGIGPAHSGELDKRFHELLLVVPGNADAGVADRERERAGIRRVGREGGHERDGALLRELDGVAEEIDEYLADADVVDVEFRESFGHFGDELVGILLSTEREDKHDLATERLEVGERGDDLHLVRLELGEVEHVVDEHEQSVRRGRNGGEIFRLLGLGNAAFAEEFGKPDDGVQRRADLVADAGDEEALRLVRRLGAFERVHDEGLAAFSGKDELDHVGGGAQKRDVVVGERMVDAFEVERHGTPEIAGADDVRNEDRPEVDDGSRLPPIRFDEIPVEGTDIVADERASVRSVFEDAADPGERPVDHPEIGMAVPRFDIFGNAMRFRAVLLVLKQTAAAGADETAYFFEHLTDALVEIILADDVLKHPVHELLVLDEAVQVGHVDRVFHIVQLVAAVVADGFGGDDVVVAAVGRTLASGRPRAELFVVHGRLP